MKRWILFFFLLLALAACSAATEAPFTPTPAAPPELEFIEFYSPL